MPQRQLAKLSFLSINPQAIGGLPFPPLHPCHGYFSVIPLLFFPLILLSVFSLFHTRLMGEYTVKADDKIPNIAGIKFPTYNTMRGAMVRDYKRGNF